jgi:hypothetical protein
MGHWSCCCDEEKNHNLCQESNPSHPTHSTVIILIELPHINALLEDCQYNNYIRFEVFMVMPMKNAILWDVMP